MIEKLKLKFGSSRGKPPLEINSTPITIFVGPNNSGKSKTLSEINSYCHGNGAAGLIIDEIDFRQILNIEEELEKYTISATTNGYVLFGITNRTVQVNLNNVRQVLSDVNSNRRQFAQYYIHLFVKWIDGNARLNLVNQQQMGDLLKPNDSSFVKLFLEDGKRFILRRIIFDAFKKFFVLDPTLGGQLRIRLSDVAPIDENEEKGLNSNAISFHSKAMDISQASDGVKAFTGIMTSIIADEPKIIIIDEPEAFLHPSLATLLGKEVCTSVKDGDKNIFVSTHSSNFLMGCIQSGAPINIIRLTYSNTIATARLLSSDRILKLMRHPLLRSTGVLNGLFYEYVIVTEADADRAFYQEINERLLMFDPSKGIPNCLFINAQGKHTVHEIMRPLREMGIPCAAILDVDVLKDGGTSWTKLLSSANVPDLTIQATYSSRSNLMNSFNAKQDSSGKPIDFKTKGGINILDKADIEACNDLFDQLDDYGIFTVRNGELESWLKNLNPTATHTPEWLIEIFEKLGEDPLSSNYIKPSTGDVWDFMGKVKAWFSNPSRKGIPE